MRKERTNLELRKIKRNDGQLEWLPRNPRQWTQTDIDNTARSIAEDEDFLEDRPLLVTPYGDEFVVFAGNLRREGAKKQKMKTVPAVVYYPETDEDALTVKRRAMKDNGSFGSFDYDILANEWDDLPLADFGVPVWDASSDMKLTTEGREGGEGYGEFVDKFKQKLTTDDCYTPPEVYAIVKDFVDEKVAPLAGRKVIRPFFPGGDYEDLKQYPEGCVVLDNPPFSIYTKIVNFYTEHNIDFFLFGPNLSLFTPKQDVCFIVANISITYENGAVVATGFVTNMVPDVRIWVESSMHRKVQEAQDKVHEYNEYILPDNIVNSARLGKISAHGGELKITPEECRRINDADGLVEKGKGLFGGGFILSTDAAKRARAAFDATFDRRHEIQLSPREQAIVDELDQVSTQNGKVS